MNVHRDYAFCWCKDKENLYSTSYFLKVFVVFAFFYPDNFEKYEIMCTFAHTYKQLKVQFIKYKTMIYKIQKSLDKISALLVDSIPEDGIGIEVKYFNTENVSIIIYQDGILKDLHINNWVFPYIYNEIIPEGIPQPDYYRKHHVCFDVIDPNGVKQSLSYSKNYHYFINLGSKESLVVEKLFTVLYMISYCETIDQFEYLYYLLYEYFVLDLKKAKEIIDFIDNIIPHLSNLKDNEYLEEFKLNLNREYEEAKNFLCNRS